jgi:hypothetical protein
MVSSCLCGLWYFSHTTVRLLSFSVFCFEASVFCLSACLVPSSKWHRHTARSDIYLSCKLVVLYVSLIVYVVCAKVRKVVAFLLFVQNIFMKIK